MMKKLFSILASLIIPFTGIIGSTGFTQAKTVTPQKVKSTPFYNHFVFHHYTRYEVWFDVYMDKSNYNGWENFYNNFGGYHKNAFRYLLQYFDDGDYNHDLAGMPDLGDGPWHWFVNFDDRLETHMKHFGYSGDSISDVAFYISTYAHPKEGWDAWMATLSKSVLKYWLYTPFLGIKFSFEWTYDLSPVATSKYQFVEANYKLVFNS